VLHGFRHQYRIFSVRDSGIHQHGIGAQFHGDGRVRSCSHACIHNERNFRDHFPQDLDVGGVLNAHPAPDRSAQRHDRARARIQQPFGDHDVI
jgi:hypothetical protein